MDEETKKIAKEYNDYQAEWLRNFEQAAKIAPIVRRNYEITRWSANVVFSAPPPTDEIPDQSLKTSFQTNFEHLKSELPMIPLMATGNSLVAFDTSGSSSGIPVYSFVARAADIQDPQTQAWSLEQSKRYEDMQVSFSREQDVHSLLKKLGPELADEFDSAMKSCEAAMGNWEPRPSAGNGMRNVLEHYKGRLFARAMNPNEQKIKWSTMADRLCITLPGSPGHQRLLEQEQALENLWKRLSDVVHNQPAGAATDLRAIRTEFLDHLYVTLKLVKLE